MLIEIHMIQNYSPANLNRDDLGAPKTCIFAGVTRARISSQCLKRAVRNPGNPEDIHNRGRSIFAEAMGEHVGLRTKLFPWLVKHELEHSHIPETEHARIVAAAQRIATAKEKDQKKADGDKGDDRPTTPQLISLGRADAKRFVAKLAELRNSDNGVDACYAYFLNPRVGFEETVRDNLDEKDLDDKTKKKIVKASWLIAKCRMGQLPNDYDDEDEASEQSSSGTQNFQDQPGATEAKRIADTLARSATADDKEDKDRFKRLTKAATREEKEQIEDNRPKKPKNMDKFISALKDSLRCNAVDVALFGRMTTSPCFEDVEAAMQVAHAISTHAAVNEVDYRTGVDDLAQTRGGAGHVDEAQFNSPCFYKYFCLDWDQLVTNLAGPEPDSRTNEQLHRKWKEDIAPQARKLAACTLGHFLRAAALDNPRGKQNSHAAHNDACGILVEIKKRRKVPTNYANAFAEPVERIGAPDDDAPDEKSLEGRSVACLAEHVQALRHAYGVDSTLLWYSPKLWRFPFRYWTRDGEGRKLEPKYVTEKRFDILGGEEGKPPGLIEAVLGELGFEWTSVSSTAKATEAGSKP